MRTLEEILASERPQVDETPKRNYEEVIGEIKSHMARALDEIESFKEGISWGVGEGTMRDTRHKVYILREDNEPVFCLEMSEPPCIQSPELTNKNGGFDITEEDAAMLIKAFDRLNTSIDAYKEHFGMNDTTEIDILKLLKKLDPDTFDKALEKAMDETRDLREDVIKNMMKELGVEAPEVVSELREVFDTLFKTKHGF
jgi:vacuolar-type H+-ATPase subunit H